MRTIINNILICTAIIIFSASCSDEWLELHPSNNMLQNEAIVTVTDARYAINGVYFEIQRSAYYGGNMTYQPDLLGGDMRTWGLSTTRTGDIYRWDFAAGNAPAAIWQQAYAVIRQANNVLAAIDNVEYSSNTLTPAQRAVEDIERDYIKGEALMARAMAHFDICRVYGYPYLKDNGASLGAVIVKEALPRDAKPKRSTVAETYNELIIPDLKNAINLMESRTRANTQGRFTKWSAKLLLSRVYLYMGDWENALREAEECIAGAEASGCALYTNANYTNAWASKHSSESLFEIINLTGQNAGASGVAGHAAAHNASANHEIGITLSFYNHLNEDTDDVRLRLLRRGSIAMFANEFPGFILKYTSGGTTPANSNIILYRLSEAYLNAAEAAARLGNQNDKALQYLNAIVSRANPANSLTGDVTWQNVLEERRKELFGEGHRFFDLLRNGLTVYRENDDLPNVMRLEDRAKVIDWYNFRAVMPIPIMELEMNPNIQPNVWNN